MAELKKEYTDRKNKRHKVAHLMAPSEDNNKEQIIQELFRILSKADRRIRM